MRQSPIYVCLLHATSMSQKRFSARLETCVDTSKKAFGMAFSSHFFLPSHHVVPSDLTRAILSSLHGYFAWLPCYICFWYLLIIRKRVDEIFLLPNIGLGIEARANESWKWKHNRKAAKKSCVYLTCEGEVGDTTEQQHSNPVVVYLVRCQGSFGCVCGGVDNMPTS